MFTGQWQPGLVAVAVGLHLLAVGLAYRRRDRTSEPTASAPERHPVGREAGVIECPTCEAENDPDYRYCRSCVSELPDPVAFDGAGNTPLGRSAR
jgi:hypothetical protein